MKIEVHSPTIRRKEMDAVLTAMVEDQIGPGERSRLLLQTAKEHLRFDFALALRSPATALHLALKSLNLQAGDGVLVSALSPAYYARVLADLQLVPLYCDVSYSFPYINRGSIEKTIADNKSPAKCIVLHHTLGFVPDAAAIAALGIPVIEDISQSYIPPMPDNEPVHANQGTQVNTMPPQGALLQGVSLHGVFAILGLEERDMLTSGGGALLFAMNRRDSQMLRVFSNIPSEYCLPDINAALANVQFKEAVRNVNRRLEIADVYNRASLQTRHKRFVSHDGGPEYCNYAFSLVLESGVKDVVAYARKKEIIVENAFEQSLTGAGISDRMLCPVSYSLSLRTVQFPLYPRLRSQEVERVSKLIMTLP
jgi:dTDP-4-amino-4,6-dideoxygalactose transaminase